MRQGDHDSDNNYGGPVKTIYVKEVVIMKIDKNIWLSMQQPELNAEET